jgi:hypothetical protein
MDKQKLLAMPNCVVCNTLNAERLPGFGDFAKFDCPRCGSFVLSRTAEIVLEELLAEVPLRRSLMSHTLRRMQRPGETHLRTINSEDLPTFWRDGRLPTPQQQVDNLILWIGDNQKTPFEDAEATGSLISGIIGAATSESNDGWSWLHSQLESENLYRLRDVRGKSGLRLSMDGWKKYEDLKRVRADSRLAFMAMKFGEQRVDDVIETCFKPAVARTGFELRKVTDQQPAGLIDDQMRAALLSGRFVIADLTHGSHGAYWEAGFAEGLGLPVIYTCEKSAWEGQSTHFDTNHMVTIIWDESDLGKAGTQLAATIRATLRAEAKQSD